MKLTPFEMGDSTRSWPLLLPERDGEFNFIESLQRTDSGIDVLRLHVTDELDPTVNLPNLLKELSRHYTYVLAHFHAATPMRALLKCLAQSELAYVLFQQSTDSLYSFNRLMGAFRSEAKSLGAAIKPILFLEKDEGARRDVDFSKIIGSPVHAILHGSPGQFTDSGYLQRDLRTGGFKADIRRLAREVGRRRIGLALSSGAARGLAHIGVFQVLEENGIEIDVVAGCSMGAYVGAVWAYGYGGALMEKLAREMEGRWGLWKLIDPVFPPRQGFLRGLGVKHRLQKSIGDAHFSDLMHPLRVVATQFETLERKVFSSGEVAATVHASSAIPGVCVPVRIAGQTYIDGGISDPLPVDVLKQMGIERIIAVNTIPTPSYLECSRELEREQAELKSRWSRVLKFFHRQVNYFAPGNILDIMQRSILGAQIRIAEESCRKADLVLRPLCCDGHWYDFTHPGKYIALGRRVAEEHLDQIKSLVSKKESTDENLTVHDELAAAA
ncbi:MAG TPA: patatin-like phospholipase family protein [Candidatus Eisenbacteria bacterium]|nr:patatin-like phospholipase family protein [Candidatus Eisenbacteria bacterium]